MKCKNAHCVVSDALTEDPVQAHIYKKSKAMKLKIPQCTLLFEGKYIGMESRSSMTFCKQRKNRNVPSRNRMDLNSITFLNKSL